MISNNKLSRYRYSLNNYSELLKNRSECCEDNREYELNKNSGKLTKGRIYSTKALDDIFKRLKDLRLDD